ncbi:MAG: hypothetical protein FWG28_05225 [Clostridiales bacterium]|nr:hypothetical protein [Clostridiales bacterium]
MNHSNYGVKYGVDQYRFAHNYDLKDSSLIIKDADKEYSLAFAGKEKLSFDFGEGARDYKYECLKIEADTYFLRFGENVAVIELSEGRATLVLSEGYVFGVIGRGAPEATHGFTDEMTGTGVRWVLGCDKFTDHVYNRSDLCRASWSPREKDFVEYPAKYVKIKAGIYLVDIEGHAGSRLYMPEGHERIITLQDYEHMLMAGCVYMKSGVKTIGAYGEFPDFDRELFA